LKLAGFEGRFSPLPVLAAALALTGLTMLGVWQLNRADEKRQILAAVEAASTLPALSAHAGRSYDWAALQFRAMEVQGRMDLDHQFLLDNQVNEGHVGFNVLTPLLGSELGEAVLIDRGFVPIAGDRTRISGLAAPCAEDRITASVYRPLGEGFRLGAMDEGEHSWPRTVQFIDLKLMSERLGYRLAPVILRMSANHVCGFKREWKPIAMSPERHIAYAVQWFAMALTVLIIFIVLAVRRRIA
jgi:surfeit locus 1 family protein